MAEPLGTLSFASLVRRGLAAGIETLDASPAGTSETVLLLTVEFEGTLQALPTLSMVGPGDIVGLDSRVVVRTWPRPDEQDAEFDHLVLMEFDQADLPWRYTPAKENAANQLRPWFNLVVLEEERASIAPPAGAQKLPILTAQLADLPDLAGSFAWAHTQLEGASLAGDEPRILERLEGAPGLFVARLLSPRILQRETSYVACLVPTFKRGQLAGTGNDPGNTDALELAWKAGDPDPVTLPVYYSFRFRTGSVGSFKDLARRIQPRVIPKEVGRRPMSVNSPGLGLPDAATTPLAVEGALQSIQASIEGPTPWPSADKTAWLAALRPFLADPKLLVEGAGVQRVVGPPLYGQWYAAENALGNPRPTGTNPPWFFELDSDPRTRVAAALGTSVIQNEQEALLASGWRQVGELPAINYERKVLQLGREAVFRLFTRHVLTGELFTFFSLTGRLHGRVICGTETVCAELDGSRIGGDLFDPAWRRWARPFGWLGRRQGRPRLTGANVSDLLDRLNDGQRPAPEPGPPGGIFTTQDTFRGLVPGDLTFEIIIELLKLGKTTLEYWGLLLLWVVRDLLVVKKGDCYWLALKALRFAIGLIRMAHSEQDIRLRITVRVHGLTPADVQNSPPNPNFHATQTLPGSLPVPPTPGGPGTTDSADAAAFRLALIQLLIALTPPPVEPLRPPMDFTTCRLALRTTLDPNLTVAESMLARLSLDPSIAWNNADPLEPIFAPPEYEEPMYLPLSEVSQDWILPGLNRIKQDSAGLAITNQRFIEAYMVGLNHEMTRELLWNEFPTDQRGTYFRQFWDTRGFVQEEGSTIPPEQFRDVLPLRLWSPTSQLGQNSARRSAEHLVLVLRAELVRRYPNVIVYAVQAKPQSQGPGLTTIEKHPVFYGLMKPDVAFYGFELTADQVRGDPGWYFVLQEQPGEPKFGGSGAGPFAAPPAGTSGDVASVTYQVPFRVGIHGSTMISGS